MRWLCRSLTLVLVLVPVSGVAGQTAAAEETVPDDLEGAAVAGLRAVGRVAVEGRAPADAPPPGGLERPIEPCVGGDSEELLDRVRALLARVHPGLSFDDYYNQDPLRDIVRHLTISVATTPIGTASDAGSAIGLGIRTIPVPGAPHPRLESRRDALKKAADGLSEEDEFLASRPRLIGLLKAALRSSGAVVDAEVEQEANALQPFVDKAIALDIERRKLRIKLNEGDSTAKAQLDANTRAQSQLAQDLLRAIAPANANEAAATAGAERDTGGVEQARGGADRTCRQARSGPAQGGAGDPGPGYSARRPTPGACRRGRVGCAGQRHEEGDPVEAWPVGDSRVPRLQCPADAGTACSTAVDFLAVVRYLSDRRADVRTDSWELGGRLVWQAQRQLAISAEWLERVRDDADTGRRVVGVAEYQLNDTAILRELRQGLRGEGHAAECRVGDRVDVRIRQEAIVTN